MRGRKPKVDNVIPMRSDDPAVAREVAMRRAVARLRPKGLSPELRKEWARVAFLLADPIVDRLKARFTDVILEYCRVTVRLRTLRASFETVADEVREISGRHGEQLKAHPHVAQMNEAWRQWRSLVAMLGLSPADERNMLPGQGDLFDESEREFA